MEHSPRRDLSAARESRRGPCLRRLGPSRLRGAAPGGAAGCPATRVPRPGFGLLGPEVGVDCGRGAGRRALAHQPGRLPRSLHPAPARADLSAAGRVREGPGTTRAIAQDAVLPFAGLASDRSHLRAAQGQPALRAACCGDLVVTGKILELPRERATPRADPLIATDHNCTLHPGSAVAPEGGDVCW